MFRSKRPKEKREFNPRAHGAIYLIAAFYLCTLVYDLVKSYLAGGEEAPSGVFLALGTAVLGGGAALLVFFARRMFRMPSGAGGEEEDPEGAEAGDGEDP